VSTEAATRRFMELPRVLRVADERAELAQMLFNVCRDLKIRKVCFVSGPNVTSELAVELAAALSDIDVTHQVVHDNATGDVDELAQSPNLRRATAAVAVGGGKTIDVTKLACEMADRAVITIPTQLATDGIASPISVVQDLEGQSMSVRARLPVAVLADLSAIETSPLESMRAGFGDLLANPSALFDWRLAERHRNERVDDFAALLAQAATDLVTSADVATLEEGTPDRALLRRLLEGLVLSGLAMEIAGSSRPCSGSEHLISHALDRLRTGTAMHGEQVAFGAMLSARIQGRDWEAVRELIRRAGMEEAAAGFGLTAEQVLDVLELAPSTRAGRFTILDFVDGNELQAAVDDVLGV